MTQGEWVKESLFQSRTFWGAAFLALVALVTWIIVVPKDLAGWVALMSSLTAIVAGWVAANKTQANIDAKTGGTDGQV